MYAREVGSFLLGVVAPLGGWVLATVFLLRVRATLLPAARRTHGPLFDLLFAVFGGLSFRTIGQHAFALFTPWLLPPLCAYLFFGEAPFLVFYEYTTIFYSYQSGG